MALITTSNPIVRPNTPLSYFMSISIHQAQPKKIRLKIPKLLAKTMQRRRSNHQYNDKNNVNDQCMNKPKSYKPRRIFPKKVGSIIHNVFGIKKSQEKCNSNEAEAENSIYRSHSLKENLELEYEKELDHEMFGEQKSDYNKPSSSFGGFFKGKTGLSFFKAKTKIPENCNGSYSDGSTRIDHTSTNGKLIRVLSSNLLRVPSKRPSGNREIRKARSMRKKVTKNGEERTEEEEEEEGGGGEELCKKRILMGEKCRPLNLSGALHYDNDGILLPEVLSSDQL